MSEQQSRKRGLASEGQKEARARDSYAPIPPSNEVGGAFGDHKRHNLTDEDLSLSLNDRRVKQRKREEDR
ncbi:MAG TPA: hypothetical protein VIF64_23145 [Pyrinomonadaceae bacterium]